MDPSLPSSSFNAHSTGTGGNNHDHSGGGGWNQLNSNNPYYCEFDVDMLLSTCGDNFWPDFLKESPAVDNNISTSLNPSHFGAGGNQLNSYNPCFLESNDNIRIEYDGNPNPMPHQLQLPAVNELSYSNDINHLLQEFPATEDNNVEIEHGGKEQYLKNVYDHLIVSPDNDLSLDSDVDSSSGENFWSGLLKHSPAVDNNNSSHSDGLIPLPQQQIQPPNKNTYFNAIMSPPVPASDTNLHSSGMPPQGVVESNGNIQFEYGGNPDPMPHQLQLPGVNELSYYKPFIQESNNNIQQFEYGGNPNPMPHQLQLPAVNEQNPMDFDGSDVNPPLNISSDLLEDSPAVNSINNVKIGEFPSSSSNSSHFNDETAAHFVSNIPAGFRFNPSDEELIVHFLGREVSHSGSHTTPEIIKHANIYEYEPHQLPDLAYSYKYANGKMYFYTSIKKKGENKTERVVKSGDGYWRATQAPKPIRNENGHTIGTKTSITYMRYTEKNRAKGEKTPWLMYEYKLPVSRKSHQELVLVVIYYHKGKSEGEVV